LQHRKRDVELHNDIDALFNLALAYEDLKMFGEAAGIWKQAQNIDPADPDIQQGYQQCSELAQSTKSKKTRGVANVGQTPKTFDLGLNCPTTKWLGPTLLGNMTMAHFLENYYEKQV
jgi:hypothetical protein